jgi:hypothetical protein
LRIQSADTLNESRVQLAGSPPASFFFLQRLSAPGISKIRCFRIDGSANGPGQDRHRHLGALRADRWAVADGLPYVRRYYLDRIRGLLSELGAVLPEVPKHDPSSDVPHSWEIDVRNYIEQLHAKQKVAEDDRETDKGSE